MKNIGTQARTSHPHLTNLLSEQRRVLHQSCPINNVRPNTTDPVSQHHQQQHCCDCYLRKLQSKHKTCLLSGIPFSIDV